MIRILIIEDEKPSARRLERILNKLDVEVVGMLHSVAESIDWFLNNEHPDLLLLDIQLSDGISFEIFEEVDVNCAIIFTTAYDEYALKAFKLNSIDYLLKPIDQDELETAINKFKSNQKVGEKMVVDLNQIQKLLINPIDRNYKKRYTTKVGQHLKILHIDDIQCFYSEHKATYCVTGDGKSNLLDYSLEQLEDQIDPLVFFRVNRKMIIRMDAIVDIISYTNSRLQIKLDSFREFDIIVSRERVRDFKNWIN